MKTALLMYSKHHFNPQEQFTRSTSAGIIAQSLYQTLIASGYQTDYIDPTEADTLTKKHYNLFVGQPDNWWLAYQNAQSSINCIFLPTTHPLRRNKIMRQQARRWKMPLDELLPFGREQHKAFTKADYILQIGNQYAIQALLQYGIPQHKIIHLHYGVNYLNSTISDKSPSLDAYLHLVSELGLRKGVLDVLDTFSHFSHSFILTLVGQQAKGYAEKVDRTIRQDSRLHYIPHLDSSSDNYAKIIQNHAWMVFPSHEEAEPGTVIDAMTYGCVPLLEPKGSGIDYQFQNQFDQTFQQQVVASQHINQNDYGKASLKAKHYVQLIHDYSTWKEKLISLWNNIDRGSFAQRPTVSIVLTLFNKERIVRSLLKTLWQSTKTYQNWDIHIIYDGCTDQTQSVAQPVLKQFSVPVYEYVKPNWFETRANNFGLKQARGTYCVIIQDDNFISEPFWLEKMISWLEQYPKIAVLGGLAGVKFFPLDTQPNGIGVAITPEEVLQRLDWRLDKTLWNTVYEVDAVMRGPTILRKHLLEKHGYLDEAYAPLYNDDMDYCFRMKQLGYSIFCYPIRAENRRLTMANYDPFKGKRFVKMMRQNSQLFYSRWQSGMGKHDHYLVLPKPTAGQLFDSRSRLKKALHRLTTQVEFWQTNYKNWIRKLWSRQ
jgi:GT2 family glycosyltransferase/glycosyltransferase involved in cell wall biosynthesis